MKDEGKEEVDDFRLELRGLKEAHIQHFVDTLDEVLNELREGQRPTTKLRALVQWVQEAKVEMTAKQERFIKLRFVPRFILCTQLSSLLFVVRTVLRLRRETPVEVFALATKEFNEALEALLRYAETCSVPVPWQIRFAAERSGDGKVELKGTEPQGLHTDGQVAELLTRMGTTFGKRSVCRSPCLSPNHSTGYFLGHVIQDGAEGEGEVTRYS